MTASRGEPVRRMPRAQRREQILDAATRAFARAGFAGTGLDEVADEAGITRVILYRHFESKTDLYRAVLDRACARIAQTVGAERFDENSIAALVRAAAADPDGFRLLFRYAPREPEFRDITESFAANSAEVTHRNIVPTVPDGPWTNWAARLLPTITTEAVIAWLESGQPDPDEAADRIGQVVHSVLQAAHPR